MWQKNSSFRIDARQTDRACNLNLEKEQEGLEQFEWTPLFISILALILVCSWTCCGYLLILLRRERSKNTQKSLQPHDLIAACDETLMKTAQVLAHDVRKPFSMMQMTIETLLCLENTEEVKEAAQLALPQVQKAMSDVSKTLKDALEIGSAVPLSFQGVAPEFLLHASLSEVFQDAPQSDVRFSYQLNHRTNVLVDPVQMRRVICNILTNAKDALQSQGEIWFHTQNVRLQEKEFVEICIGNNGPSIAQSELSKIFEPFYTKEKKVSNGFGLAIAKKIVLGHGGTLWCKSDLASPLTEFNFTLPIAPRSLQQKVCPMPENSGVLAKVLEMKHPEGMSNERESEVAREFEQSLELLLKKSGHKIRVLLVDDETVYCRALASNLTQNEIFRRFIEITTASNAEAALKICFDIAPQLVILDVDLGNASKNGIDLLKDLRQANFKGQVCIHSNRSLPQDYKIALEAGADTVLPKPMGKAHLLKMLIHILKSAQPESAEIPTPIENKSPKVAVLDDSHPVLKAWQFKLRGKCEVHVFDSPESFWSKLKAEPNFLKKLHCVITDHYFAPSALQTGLEFAQELRPQTSLPILLSSDGIFDPEDLAGVIDKVIPKGPQAWEQLLILLAEISRNSPARGSQL